MTADLDDFRATVRQWCRTHVPADWRAAQTGAGDEEFVAFQKAWFAAPMAWASGGRPSRPTVR